MSYCPRCSEPLDQRAVVCPHCGYDFPQPRTPGAKEGLDWFGIFFGLLWLAGGLSRPFLDPGGPADGLLAGFLAAAGLACILACVRPLLGPKAARVAEWASTGSAVLATGMGVASLCLGKAEGVVVVWVLLITGLTMFWVVRRLWRAAPRSAAAGRPPSPH